MSEDMKELIRVSQKMCETLDRIQDFIEKINDDLKKSFEVYDTGLSCLKTNIKEIAALTGAA